MQLLGGDHTAPTSKLKEFLLQKKGSEILGAVNAVKVRLLLSGNIPAIHNKCVPHGAWSTKDWLPYRMVFLEDK